MSRFACLLIISTLSILAGCQGSAPTTRNFSHLPLAGTSRELAFDAAEASVRTRFPIAASDRIAGTITSEPVESREPTAGGRIGDLIGAPRRIRRVTTVRVTGADDSAEVWCKVLIEEQDTAAARMFTNDLSQYDAPTSTAADRDAATTREQNEIWRTVRRDKLEERAVLRAVQESLADPRGA